VPWLKRLDPQQVWINPQDAATRAIADGDPVEVYSPRGTVRLPAKVTGRIMPGVVCIYQGAWYQPGADGVDQGGCANALTTQRLSPSGGLATHTGWVEIRAARRPTTPAPDFELENAPETGPGANVRMEE
jgi:anaerobic dimethyl sulfoxide reductase subunit A